MYSFFDLSGSLAARCAAAAVGTMIVTFILLAPGMTSGSAAAASPAEALLSVTPDLAEFNPATLDFTTLAFGAFA